MQARTVELLDRWPQYHLQLIGGIQAPGPCTDLLGHQLKCPPTPDLLRRGSAPWRGGTVTICSRAKSSQPFFAHIGSLPLSFTHRAITWPRASPTMPDLTRLALSSGSPPILSNSRNPGRTLIPT